MDLNMRAASNGMLLLRHLLQPFLREPLPVKLTENAVTYRMIPVSKAAAANAACPTCQTNNRFGYGDCGPPLGFAAETAARIMGEAKPEIIALKAPRWLRPPHFLRRVFERFAKAADH